MFRRPTRRDIVGIVGIVGAVTVGAMLLIGQSTATDMAMKAEVAEPAKAHAIAQGRALLALLDDPATLEYGKVSAATQKKIDQTAKAGRVFYYKFMNPNAVVVLTTNPKDLGKRDYHLLGKRRLKEGLPIARLVNRPLKGVLTRGFTGMRLVAEAYVPVMENGKMRGGVLVHVDVDPNISG